MCHGSAVVRWDSFIRTQYSNWILAKYRAAGDSFRKPQLQPSWGPPSPQPFTPAAAGGLSSKLFIIFWWFIAANFELGVISLKLDAHTKRTNELTEREKRREKETHFTVNGAFLGKNLNKEIEIHFMKIYLTIFKSCDQQKHDWIIKEVSTRDHQNGSFVITVRASQVWNPMAI